MIEDRYSALRQLQERLHEALAMADDLGATVVAIQLADAIARLDENMDAKNAN